MRETARLQGLEACFCREFVRILRRETVPEMSASGRDGLSIIAPLLALRAYSEEIVARHRDQLPGACRFSIIVWSLCEVRLLRNVSEKVTWALICRYD